MDCKEIKKIIDKANILNLEAEEFIKFNEHLKVCKQCADIYKEYSDLQTILKEHYENIPVNIQEKQKALILIEKYMHKKRLFSPLPALVFTIFILLISFGIFKYIQYKDTKKEQIDFLTNLVYVHNNNNLEWVNLEYNNPTLKKLKKCKYCKYSEDIKVLKFKMEGGYASIFILEKRKFARVANIFKYYELNNKYIYLCNTHPTLIHIWVSDIPIDKIASFLFVSKCPQSIKNTIRIKSKKLACPCCLAHLMKTIKKYKGCIINIEYKTQDLVVKVRKKEKTKEIEKLF